MKILFIIAVCLSLLSCSRKDSITRFSEENEMDKEYYLYPSTLRMINLEETEEFDEVIDEFVMGKYFSISNNKENSLLISDLKANMIKEGYEEAMIFKNSDQDFSIYILEREVPLISAIVKTDSVFNIIQIEGMINIAKIPKLLEVFKEDDYINILEFIKTEKDKAGHGQHSQD